MKAIRGGRKKEMHLHISLSIHADTNIHVNEPLLLHHNEHFFSNREIMEIIFTRQVSPLPVALDTRLHGRKKHRHLQS